MMRCRSATILFAALLAAAPGRAQQQPATSAPRATLAEDVRLSTITPLGEAVITITAGDKVDVAATENDRLLLSRGPFSAWVDASVIAPPPTPAQKPAPPAPAPAKAPLPAHEAWFRSVQDFLMAQHPAVLAGGACLIASLGGLLVLAAKHRRLDRTLRRMMADRRLPDGPLRPSSIVITCPHCAAALPVSAVTEGRDACPHCKGPLVPA